MSSKIARRIFDAIRYEPSRLDLSLAYGASHPAVPQAVARWVAAEHAQPSGIYGINNRRSSSRRAPDDLT